MLQRGRSGSKAILCTATEQVFLEPGDCIVAMDYLMEKEALLIGTSSGCLLLHIIEFKTTEVVGRVEGGVKSISSSPDGALLAVTAGLGQLLVMTHDWEVLYETEFDQQLSDKEITGGMHSSPYCGPQAPISWRDDGKYLATLGGNKDVQKISIWERESGVLHSSSESKKFVGTSLDWMPGGAKLVAAYDRKYENKPPLIVFFEKNGLERNSFSIDEPVETMIKTLKWNCNSDLLAASISCDDYDAIKIWSFSNYHWYLKQEIRYSKQDAVQYMWDPTKPLHLICWSRGGQVTAYNFVWITAVTETSTALVIDNSNILITPFSLSLIPPPMSLFKVKFCSPVQNITFLSENLKNQLAACLSNGNLCIVELPKTDMWEQFQDEEFIVDTSSSALTTGTLMHLTWLDSRTLLGVSYSTADLCTTTSLMDHNLSSQESKSSHDFSLLEIVLVCSEDSVPGTLSSSGWSAKISKKSSLQGPVISIVRNPAKRCSAFVQMDGGSILEYSSTLSFSGGFASSHLHGLDSEDQFSSSCPWMKAVLFHNNGIVKPLVFGLDDNGRLHFGKRILCNNCSSFSFYSKADDVAEEVVSHLLLTTKQDLLFIISLNDIVVGNLEVDLEREIITHKRGENKEHLHVWERWAKIVGVIHGDEAAVILQTARGNLECIYPRKLVLVSIINALVQRRFRDALLMVRRHRIDFNVIIDCCGWQAFIASAIDFVKQVNNLSHITEFVCSIKNDDVMDTLYKSYISIGTLPRPTEDDYQGCEPSKVSRVLLAVRKALVDHVEESSAREMCILTTLARAEPPALEEALVRIKMIRELELLGADDSKRKLFPSSEESLRHLLWLTDSEAVYEAALGLYDLNLAAIVALNSQKDPKEFLPYLRGLGDLQPVVMQYTIDLKLHRYERALRHIVSAGEDYFEDCMNLMRNNPELFPLGLQLFTNNTKRIQVMEALGDHLQAEKHFQDAASTYLCCSSFHKALKAYHACGDWKGMFTVAGLLNLGKAEVLQLANELCEECQALGKPAEAARIALEYCADVSRGVGYYIMAREWDEALRIAYIHDRDDLVSDVKNGALECASTMISEYKEGSEKVGKYLARYLAVRQRRLVLAAKLQAEDSTVNDADYDTVSEASSNFSGMSAYTTRTTKNSGVSVSSTTASKARDMRRQRKKGGKIRAGSPGEELALVDHLKGMSLTTSAQRELKSLIMVLLMLGKEEIARRVQQVADTFQLSQEAAMKLTEDTIANETIDEKTQTLDHYMKKLKQASHSRVLYWQSKVLLPA